MSLNYYARKIKNFIVNYWVFYLIMLFIYDNLLFLLLIIVVDKILISFHVFPTRLRLSTISDIQIGYTTYMKKY